MALLHRVAARNRMFEFFMMSAVVVLASAVSFIFLREILAEARDTQRLSDIATLRNALELYYIDHGTYPATGWTNSAAASWSTLERHLGRYVTAMPRDPTNDESGPVERTGAFNYTYYSAKRQNATPNAAAARDNYLLIFRLERPQQAPQHENTAVGLVTARGGVSYLDLTRA